MIKIERKEKKNKRIIAANLEAGNVFSPTGSVEPYLFLGYDAEDAGLTESAVCQKMVNGEGYIENALTDDLFSYKVVYSFSDNQIKCIFDQSEVVVYDAILQITPKLV